MTEKNKTAIIVIGPPGSGKGTQAKLLAEKFDFFHFITSQVGKEYIFKNDDLDSRRQMENYKKGILFEPSWLLNVVKEKTKEIIKEAGGIVYDGSPRTLYEAEGIYPFLADIFGKENIEILEIQVSEDEIRIRLSKRLICDKNSSHVFIRSEKFYLGVSCPENDGGILQKRDLDREDLFEIRMNEYKNRTVPGLEFLKKEHNVITINGEQAIEDVFKEILDKIELKI